jgi:ketosteroid isomerase-like protein
MNRASQATVDLLNDYYTAMRAKDLATCRTYCADDMTVTFANNPRIDGADAFFDVLSGMLAQVTSLHHDIVNAWESDDGSLIFESSATWTLLDGQTLRIPACSILTMDDGKVAHQRIYVDNAPLFDALTPETEPESHSS